MEPRGLTFTELLGRLAFPKSSLHELLVLLRDRSYVVLDEETRRFTVGIRAWEVGQAYIRHRELVDVVLEEMERIVALMNETVQMSVLDGVDNVYLAKVDCTHPLRLQTDVGKRFPAHASALGKVLLAHLPPGEAAERVRRHELRRLTPNSITSPELLLQELARVHAQGFGVDREEGMQGLRCVAVPIRDHQGVVAALSASIPVFRATVEQMATATRLLAGASLTVSRRLGAAADDPALTRLLTLAEGELRELLERRLEPLAEQPV